MIKLIAMVTALEIVMVLISNKSWGADTQESSQLNGSTNPAAIAIEIDEPVDFLHRVAFGVGTVFGFAGCSFWIGSRRKLKRESRKSNSIIYSVMAI